MLSGSKGSDSTLKHSLTHSANAFAQTDALAYFFWLFAIYGWMVFCFIPTKLACFVQNVVD